ncbi:hypothetical protein HMPREF0731_3372, partial [Pseudoroseomonas cervicalis ATCC 49957]
DPAGQARRLQPQPLLCRQPGGRHLLRPLVAALHPVEHGDIARGPQPRRGGIGQRRQSGQQQAGQQQPGQQQGQAAGADGRTRRHRMVSSGRGARPGGLRGRAGGRRLGGKAAEGP